MHFSPSQLLLLPLPICSHLPRSGHRAAPQGSSKQSRVEQLFTALAGMSQNDICLFSNNITLSIHAWSLLFSGPQTGLCSSPIHLPILAFFWAPEFSFLNAALSLSFTLLILDPFYFVLSELLWIPVLSVKVLLRLLQPHAVENVTEAKIHHIHSIPLPTSPVTLPEKEIQLVWHNLLFISPRWLLFFPLWSQSHWLIVNNSAEYFSWCWT